MVAAAADKDEHVVVGVEESGSVNAWYVSMCSQLSLIQLQYSSPPELLHDYSFSWHTLLA